MENTSDVPGGLTAFCLAHEMFYSLAGPGCPACKLAANSVLDEDAIKITRGASRRPLRWFTNKETEVGYEWPDEIGEVE